MRATSMSRSKSKIRILSDIPLVPQVFFAACNEPMPIDPPNTSYLTTMPEAHAGLTEWASEEQPSRSRWKPLVGTPSKPPVPQNILVPDPSPSRDVDSDESPNTLATSTPGSFIHRRRQGEYVPRPPVWKIYDLQADFSASPNGLEDTDTETCDSEEDVFTSFRRRYTSDRRLGGLPVAEQVNKMANIFSKAPELVEMRQPTGTILAHGMLDKPCL